MICEAYLSKKLLGFSDENLLQISDTILEIYPEINIAKEDFSGIIKLMYQDKKNLNNLLNHSLLMDIGKATYDIAVDEKDVIDSLFYFTKLKH